MGKKKQHNTLSLVFFTEYLTNSKPFFHVFVALGDHGHFTRSRKQQNDHNNHNYAAPRREPPAPRTTAVAVVAERTELKARLRDLEAKVSESTASMQKEKHVEEDVLTKVKELEARVVELSEEATEKSKMLDREIETRRTLKEGKRKAEEFAQQREQELSNMNSRLIDVTQQRNNSLDEAKVVKEELAKLKGTNHNLRRQMEDLRKERDKQEVSFVDREATWSIRERELKERVRLAEEERDLMQKEARAKTQINEELQASQKMLRDKLETTLKKKEDQVSNLKERLKMTQGKMAKLAGEKKRAAALNNALGKARLRLEEIQKGDERWRKKVCDLERELAMARGEVRAAEMVAMEKVTAMRKMPEKTAHATTAVALASPSPSVLSSVLTVPAATSPALVPVQHLVAAQQVPGVPSAPTSSPAASMQSITVSSMSAGAAHRPQVEDGEEEEVDEFALLTPHERRTCEHIYVGLEGALAPEDSSHAGGTNSTARMKPEDATSMYAALYNNVVAIHSGGLEGDLVRLTLNRAFRLYFGLVPEEGASAARAFYQRRRQQRQQ